MLNFIENVHATSNADVHRRDESCLFAQPDRPKEKVGMFNFWNEKKRSGLSNEASTEKLILDYDDGLTRADAENVFSDFSYIIYSSTGNNAKEGVEKFRIILDLKEPIKAEDLKWWRNRRAFRKFFDGVDFSSFAIGRFFYRPSKYDKGGEEVKIVKHEGRAFDFYKMFPKHESCEMFDKIKAKMLNGIVKKPKAIDYDGIHKLKEWIASEFPSGVHRCDVPRVLNRAKWMNVDLNEAEQAFEEAYAGHCDWHIWWRELI